MVAGHEGGGAEQRRAVRTTGQKPLLVAADTYRPAAITQLEQLGKQLSITVHSEGSTVPPPQICQNAIGRAIQGAFDVVILDTAGRLQIDDRMMAEIDEIRRLTKPCETLLVADAMTGQEAVNMRHSSSARW